jgi:hypothetical protein
VREVFASVCVCVCVTLCVSGEKWQWRRKISTCFEGILVMCNGAYVLCCLKVHIAEDSVITPNMRPA